MTEQAKTSLVPIRVKSANGLPKRSSQFFRTCTTCDADFIGLAAGKTGERGVWYMWKWWCSIECTPEKIRRELKLDMQQGTAEQ